MNDVTQEIARTYEIYGESPELLPAIDRVLEADPVDAARASFERAGARDFLGLEADAIPLYRDALERGLGQPERLQCLIQLGSSLRNIGDAESAVDVLRTARAEAQGEATDWADAFLSLALHSNGQTAEALAIALSALAAHMTRYGRAVASYAAKLP
jgi:tetratricopeptide (TPR) repeat protein